MTTHAHTNTSLLVQILNINHLIIIVIYMIFIFANQMITTITYTAITGFYLPVVEK